LGLGTLCDDVTPCQPRDTRRPRPVWSMRWLDAGLPCSVTKEPVEAHPAKEISLGALLVAGPERIRKLEGVHIGVEARCYPNATPEREGGLDPEKSGGGAREVVEGKGAAPMSEVADAGSQAEVVSQMPWCHLEGKESTEPLQRRREGGIGRLSLLTDIAWAPADLSPDADS